MHSIAHRLNKELLRFAKVTRGWVRERNGGGKGLLLAGNASWFRQACSPGVISIVPRRSSSPVPRPIQNTSGAISRVRSCWGSEGDRPTALAKKLVARISCCSYIPLIHTRRAAGHSSFGICSAGSSVSTGIHLVFKCWVPSQLQLAGNINISG